MTDAERLSYYRREADALLEFVEKVSQHATTGDAYCCTAAIAALPQAADVLLKVMAML
jgi:hypothetical protein|nr:MAG TPA: hypothetical protein [Caudoviricetes sp.]